MAEILSVGEKVSILSKNLKKQGKVVVLAGGCFDVLHPGHVIFLEKAKKAGDILMVLLESDEKVRRLKGADRPFHHQSDRAQVLAALRAVDYVIMLPFLKNDAQYDELVAKIRPDMIAAAAGDKNTGHYQRSAKKIGANLKFVTKMIGNHSTSRILNR